MTTTLGRALGTAVGRPLGPPPRPPPPPQTNEVPSLVVLATTPAATRTGELMAHFPECWDAIGREAA